MATKAALRIILLLVAGLGLHTQTLAQDHIALGQSIVTLNGEGAMAVHLVHRYLNESEDSAPPSPMRDSPCACVANSSQAALPLEMRSRIL
jgi:hypothetical protein